MKGLRDGLRESGYVEGKNLIWIPSEETIDEFRPMTKAYIEKKFDVIIALGATAPLIAKELTQEIPIVSRRFRPYSIRTCEIMARPEAKLQACQRDGC